jgi:hypothetical protein
MLIALAPQSEAERGAQAQVLQLSDAMRETRLATFEQNGGALAWPFLAIVVFWISTLFLGFGTFPAPTRH